MTTEEWLSRARGIDKEIRQLQEAKREALARAAGAVGATEGEKVQTSPGNTAEKKFINYAAYSQSIDEKIDELFAVQKEIKDVIDKVEDVTLRALLTAYYINCKTWEQTAAAICKSYFHTIYRLKPKAIAAADVFLSK